MLTTRSSVSEPVTAIIRIRPTIVQDVLILPLQPAAIADSDEAQTGDCKLARDDDKHDPAGHPALSDEDHHAGRDQQLVGQRIEELAEIRDLIIMARDIAVDKIADARDHEYAERRPAQRVIPAAAKQ